MELKQSPSLTVGPYFGFGLMLVMSVLLALAALLRRKEWRA